MDAGAALLSRYSPSELRLLVVVDDPPRDAFLETSDCKVEEKACQHFVIGH